ncbi:hypothetical protein CRE_03670 [Caenorhabditis remanei]|uniref:Uncharacterized protein n=1 Tax=Caenorhabditis remanei TaxID=31234 RepID=E3LXL3_CAERE|nr:hypothetical protein CRE_03670 [Caenorhabditis remanei]
MIPMNNNYKFLLLISTIIVFIFLLQRSDNISFNNETVFQVQDFTPKFYSTWISCGERKFLNTNVNANKFWDDFKGNSNECDKEADISKNMKALPFQNRDEMKYAILPVQVSLFEISDTHSIF